LSEVNVKNVSVGIVGDMGRPHASPLLSGNLIRRHDEIVFCAVGPKTESNHGDDRGVAGRQILEVAIVKEHVGTDGILKSSPFPDGLQNFAFMRLHFRMFIANMRPTLIRQINFMSLGIRRSAKHLGPFFKLIRERGATPVSRSIIGCRSFLSQVTQGLCHVGCTREENNLKEHRYTERKPERNISLVAELVQLEANIVVVPGLLAICAATKIGLTISPNVLARADRVIR